MNKFLFIAAQFCSAIAGAQVTVVQGTQGGCNAAGAGVHSCATSSWTNTAGHAALIFVNESSQAISSFAITDPQGDSFIAIYPPFNGNHCPNSGVLSVCAYYVNKMKGGAGAITATWGGPTDPDQISIAAIEFSSAAYFSLGLTTPGIVAYNSASITTSTLTTKATNSLLVGYATSTHGVSGFTASGYTQQAFGSSACGGPCASTFNQIGILTKPQATAGSFTATISGTANNLDWVGLFSVRSADPTFGAAYTFECSGTGAPFTCNSNLDMPSTGYGLITTITASQDDDVRNDCIPQLSDTGSDSFNKVAPIAIHTVGLGSQVTYMIPSSVGGNNFSVSATAACGSQAYDIQTSITVGLASTRPVVNASFGEGSTTSTTASVTVPAGTQYLYLPFSDLSHTGPWTGTAGYIQKFLANYQAFAIQGLYDQTVTPSVLSNYSFTLTTPSASVGIYLPMIAFSQTNQTGPYVAQVTNGGALVGEGGSSKAFTLPLTAGPHNRVSIFAQFGEPCGGSGPGISDTLGLTYTAIRGGGPADVYALWDAPITASGAETVSVSCGTDNASLNMEEFHNVLGSPVSCGAQNLSATAISCSATALRAGDYVLLYLGQSGNVDAPLPTQIGTSNTPRNISGAHTASTTSADLFTTGPGSITSSGTVPLATRVSAAVVIYEPLFNPLNVNIITKLDRKTAEVLGYE